MENDSVRTSGDNTLVDMWIDGKLRSISVSAEAIDAFQRLSRERAAARTDDERREFVRTHLTLIVDAAAAKLRATGADADAVTLDRGDLGARAAPPATAGDGDRRSGERRSSEQGPGEVRTGESRSGERRRGERRKVNLGPPRSGERRRKD